MGKVRVKTIGIEEEEDKQKKKLKERNDAKKAANLLKKQAEKEIEEPKETNTKEEVAEKSADEKANKKKKNSKYKTSKKTKPHSGSYLAMAKLVDSNKKYTIQEALKILNSAKRTKFDETVELHINTTEKGVSGNLTLPHGTGKKVRIEIADNAADPKHLQELIKEIETGKVNFDILIATPESMTHLAKVARVLGPKGLMPNPKNGTISPNPKEAMKKFSLGQINFKTEPKFPIIHLSVGKLSFEEKQLSENINAILGAIQAKNIKSVTLKSTMSPGIKVEV